MRLRGMSRENERFDVAYLIVSSLSLVRVIGKGDRSRSEWWKGFLIELKNNKFN